MTNTKVNINPDPQILEAITYNPLNPINALCELIDNSIDAFSSAAEKGVSIKDPVIQISLPNRHDIDSGDNKLVVQDNGPGMSLNDATKAVTAGYSGSRNPLDKLGLFGMGFNISTGKLGRLTKLTTCRAIDKEATSIVIDIPKMKEEHSFMVPVFMEKKLPLFISGTRVEINNWWPKGSMNYGFVSKLLQIGKPKLRERLGRIYTTLLGKKLRILIDGEDCIPFHHCVWSEKRFVVHKELGKIPAQYKINKSLGVEIRCNNCWNLMETNKDICDRCSSKNSARTIDKVVKGWVGVQRFDDKDHFGIDLIRNGRAIRVLEKDAFFTWTNAENENIRDYPIDNPYGRIIGEIHIDFVPVDYLKTDFQRTSPEWSEVMKLLRGESCLQPEIAKRNNEPPNDSYIFKLYQGYRKVRRCGTKDMYMGYWDSAKGEPARISREVEKDLHEKFKQGIPGYGISDDEEWWKHVEAAEQRPIEESEECSNCGFQNPKSAETCSNCGLIFKGKSCKNNECGQKIPYSSEVCPHCGTAQYIENSPWRCPKCGKKNPPEETICRKCNYKKGIDDLLTFESLKTNSNINDDLSISGLSIPLPDNETHTSINLITHYVKPEFKLERNKIRIPTMVFITSNEFHVFIDPNHPAVSTFQDRPEDYIAMEIAKWILEENLTKINEYNRPLWSLSNLYYTVHNTVWRERIEINSQETLIQINKFFKDLFDELPELLEDEAEKIYENLDSREQSLIKQEMIQNNIDLNKFEEFIEEGDYLKYIPESLLAKIINKYPKKFFDGNFWKDPYERLQISDEKILSDTKLGILQKYIACLNDITSYKNNRNPDSDLTQKVNQTLKIINKNRINE